MFDDIGSQLMDPSFVCSAIVIHLLFSFNFCISFKVSHCKGMIFEKCRLVRRLNPLRIMYSRHPWLQKKRRGELSYSLKKALGGKAFKYMHSESDIRKACILSHTKFGFIIKKNESQISVLNYSYFL